jgi:GNAT superfamily N-acetyltransferase
MATEFQPVTRERWPDLDRLFSDSAGEDLGNPSRCWCMEWRLAQRDDWESGAGELNRERLRSHIESGFVPGLIAYVDEVPAAWISVSPRTDLIGMRGQLKHPDATDIWSVICFYVAEAYRGQGLMRALLEAATRHASMNGARIIEGYPFVKEMAGDGAGGTLETFEQAGFRRMAEVRPGQWTVRCYTQAK